MNASEPKVEGSLVYYRIEEVEALARAMAEGRHRTAREQVVSVAEREAQRAEDLQDAEMVRVSAYAGLRLGELLSLRWRDVDFAGQIITVGRAMSAGIETSTKSGRVRLVPLVDPAAAALDRVSHRLDFTDPDELVFCNALGRTLDHSALRRRFRRAQAAAGLRPLRWHDLRHTYGSLLAAHGIDLVSIKDAMGHSALATTGALPARTSGLRAGGPVHAGVPASGGGTRLGDDHRGAGVGLILSRTVRRGEGADRARTCDLWLRRPNPVRNGAYPCAQKPRVHAVFGDAPYAPVCTGWQPGATTVRPRAQGSLVSHRSIPSSALASNGPATGSRLRASIRRICP